MTVVDQLGMPDNLIIAAAQQGREGWLATLPQMVSELKRRWSLEVGEPFQPGGQTAWVGPARTETNSDLVLKLEWRHFEAEHETDALQMWNGEGAVRLHLNRLFGDTIAMVLERCLPGISLATQPQDEQDRVIAGLLRRLWREPPPGHRFRPLQAMCDAWADEFEAKVAARPSIIDADVARIGMDLFRNLPRTADQSVLLCTDLHAGNVLAAKREPWLIIDPKPFIGDPTYDVLQHMLNCRDRLLADARAMVREMAALFDLDEERLRLWLFARCVQESPEWPDLAEVAYGIKPY